MFNSKYKKQSGMTLVEVVIAMGMSTALIYSSTQAMLYMKKSTNSSNVQLALNQQWSLIENYLQNPSACQLLLNNPINSSLFDPTSSNLIHIAIRDPKTPDPQHISRTNPTTINYLFKENEKTTNNLLTTSVTLKKTVNVSTAASPSFTDVSGVIQYFPILANLEIQLTNPATQTSQNRNANVTYKKTFALTLTFQKLNSSSQWTVLSCSAEQSPQDGNQANVTLSKNTIGADDGGTCSVDGNVVYDIEGVYFCNSGKWVQLLNTTSVRCKSLGGTMQFSASTGTYCSTTSNCPSGWTEWTTTTNNYCEVDGIGNTGCAISGCNTGNHSWRAGSAETCDYRYYHGCNTPGTQYETRTCTANITRRGCIPNN